MTSPSLRTVSSTKRVLPLATGSWAKPTWRSAAGRHTVAPSAAGMGNVTASFDPTAKRSPWTPSSGSVAWTVAVATERAGISRSVSCDRGTFTPVLVASSSW